jgi:hypothetical protein
MHQSLIISRLYRNICRPRCPFFKISVNCWCKPYTSGLCDRVTLTVSSEVGLAADGVGCVHVCVCSSVGAWQCKDRWDLHRALFLFHLHPLTPTHCRWIDALRWSGFIVTRILTRGIVLSLYCCSFATVSLVYGWLGGPSYWKRVCCTPQREVDRCSRERPPATTKLSAVGGLNGSERRR